MLGKVGKEPTISEVEGYVEIHDDGTIRLIPVLELDEALRAAAQEVREKGFTDMDCRWHDPWSDDEYYKRAGTRCREANSVEFYTNHRRRAILISGGN